MAVLEAETPATAGSTVDIRAYVDPRRPLSWSAQMVALLRDGHYAEAYGILAEKMPFVENQLRPYAECLAGLRNHWTMIHERIAALMPPGDGLRILDVGCAVGSHAIEFARRGHHAWGVDILPAMIDRGRELVESLGLSGRCTLRTGDIRRLDRLFEPHTFDAAVACDIFEHLDDASLGMVLAGLERVLRPGGTLVIQTSPGRHYYWFDPDRLKLLALLAPMAWLPDRLFTAWVRGLERGPLRRLRTEHERFYRHEHGHFNCLDPVHLRDLLRGAGLRDIRVFAEHTHPGFKDEGCRRTWWGRLLFGRKSVACRNLYGVARTHECRARPAPPPEDRA